MQTDRPARVPLPRGFWIIWTTVALDLVGFGIVVPILGRYAERYGAGGFQVGLLFASFSLAQLVFSPLLGKLSDRIGRKPVIIVSLIGTCVGSLVTGAASALWMLFLGRVIDGASGASVAVAQAAVTDLAPPDQRPRLLGLLGAAFGVGFVLGPALGGLAALGGAHVPFYVAATIAGVNAVLAVVRLPETSRSPSVDGVSAPVRSIDDIAPAPRPRALAHLAVVGFVAVASFSGFEATFGLFASDRFGLTEGPTALVFLGIGIVLVGVQGGAIAPITAALGSGRVLRLGLALTACGLFALAATGDGEWWLLVFALLLIVIGQGVASPSLTALVADNAPHGRRGEALGYQHGVSAVARVAGPVTAGFLFERAGVPVPYVVAGGLSVLAVALMMMWQVSSPDGAPDAR